MGDRSNEPGSTCIIGGTAAGRKLSVTPKPCSSTKEPGNVQELINLTESFLISVAENTSSWTSLMSVMRMFRGHKAEQHRSALKRDMQSSVLPASKQAFGATGKVGWQTGAWGGRSKCTAGWMTSVTPCFRFPWRQEPTAPNPLPIPPRSCSSHSPRTHGMVADRRGRGQGSAALLQLPTLAFWLSALHICRIKAMFTLHQDRKTVCLLHMHIEQIKINTITSKSKAEINKETEATVVGLVLARKAVLVFNYNLVVTTNCTSCQYKISDHPVWEQFKKQCNFIRTNLTTETDQIPIFNSCFEDSVTNSLNHHLFQMSYEWSFIISSPPPEQITF